MSNKENIDFSITLFPGVTVLTEQEFYLKQSASSNASPPSTAASNFYDEPQYVQPVKKATIIEEVYAVPQKKEPLIVDDDFVDVALEQ